MKYPLIATSAQISVCINNALSPYCPNSIAGTLKIDAAMSTAMYGTDGG